MLQWFNQISLTLTYTDIRTRYNDIKGIQFIPQPLKFSKVICYITHTLCSVASSESSFQAIPDLLGSLGLDYTVSNFPESEFNNHDITNIVATNPLAILYNINTALLHPGNPFPSKVELMIFIPGESEECRW